MRSLIKNVAVRGATTGLAVVAFLLLTLTSAGVWGFGVAIAAAGAGLALWRTKPAADLRAESVLLTAGILAGQARQSPVGVDWALAVSGVSLLGLIIVESQLRTLADGEIQAENVRLRSSSRLPSPRRLGVWMKGSIPILLAGLAASAALSLPSWPAMAVVVLVTTIYAGLVATSVWRRLRRPAAETSIRRALERLKPEFFLHFSAPVGSEYQALMWLPYLERIGRPFFIMLRESHSLAKIAAATRAPVVVCPTVVTVDAATVPSVRAVFYVNHASKLAHTVRYAHLAHIQLHHGDSDKLPSASPVTAMFTKIFVAGQAAIDRYARNGVDIPREKFVIVGRPQVESITRARQHVRDKARKTVLYTPTWTGFYSDTNYCSLPVAKALIEQLLARDVTVILRAHPYSAKNRQSVQQLAALEEMLSADRARSGRTHVWGTAAVDKMTLVDCINTSDALVSDVSSVISDYLFSGKPYAVTDVIDEGDNVTETFPLARSGYVLRADMSNVDKTLELLLNDDPLEEERLKMRTHYLGDFPQESYAEAFLTEARRFL